MWTRSSQARQPERIRRPARWRSGSCCSAAPSSSPCTTGSGSAAPASTDFVNGPLYDAVIVSAGLACLLKARGAGRERGAWLALAAAVLCWGASEIYWTAVLVDDPSPPYPSPADIGYLAFYPLAATGVSCWSAPGPGSSTGGCGWTA